MLIEIRLTIVQVSAKSEIFDFGELDINRKGTSREEQNGATFSFVAPPSEC